MHARGPGVANKLKESNHEKNLHTPVSGSKRVARPASLGQRRQRHAAHVKRPFRPAGKEGLVITVDHAPGAADPVHRHRAHGFIYVLEGSVVMQVKGGKEVTLTPGQTFYEGPNDIHTVGRNASTSQPAKFLVVLIKKKKAEVVELVK